MQTKTVKHFRRSTTAQPSALQEQYTKRSSPAESEPVCCPSLGASGQGHAPPSSPRPPEPPTVMTRILVLLQLRVSAA